MTMPVEKNVLYQKIGVTISNLALDLLSKSAGDRIWSISQYQENFGVSRGTMQNAFRYLEEKGAVTLERHGYQGTYIKTLDHAKLQENCLLQQILGIMPLPYSKTYEGFATAIYEQLSKVRFNMAYARGAVGRIKLVETGTYQFAVVSQYAAEQAIQNGSDIEIILNFGEGSFLSRHVLLLTDPNKDGICDGMRVAYDSESIDQSRLTRDLVKGKKVELVEIRTQNTLHALKDHRIDAGIWNMDDIVENKRQEFFIRELEDSIYSQPFSTAVIVVKKEDGYIRELLKKSIHVDAVQKILQEVRNGSRSADY